MSNQPMPTPITNTDLAAWLCMLRANEEAAYDYLCEKYTCEVVEESEDILNLLACGDPNNPNPFVKVDPIAVVALWLEDWEDNTGLDLHP